MDKKIISTSTSISWGFLSVGIALIIFFLFSFALPNSMNYVVFWGIKIKYIILFLIGCWFFSSLIIIKETYQGHLSIFGKRQNTILEEGYHWLPPFYSIEEYVIKEAEFKSSNQVIHSSNQIAFLYSWNIQWGIKNLNLYSNLSKDFLPNAFIGLINDKTRSLLTKDNTENPALIKMDSSLIKNVITNSNFECNKWGVNISNLFITELEYKDDEVQQLYNSALSLDTIIDRVVIYTDKLGLEKKEVIKMIQIERGKMTSYDYNLSLDEQVSKILKGIIK